MTMAFEHDAYLQALDTEILASGEDDGRPWVVTADTVLYPEGGGQPADRGFADDVPVIDVQRHAGKIRHSLERPLAPGPVTLRLDWGRRWDHMQQHTAQHLLTALADTRFGWPTTAFHLGPEVADIELAVADLAAPDLMALEAAVADEIRAARPVTARVADPAELAAGGVRTRGLPDGHRGPVRLVEIDGLDLNTCGGTHLRSTAEIGVVSLLGHERLRGGCRLFFVAGDRVRRRMREHELRSARLRTLLGAPDHELAAAVELRLGREQELGRHLKKALAELARTAARGLADSGAVVSAHWDEHDLAFVVAVARHLAELSPTTSALLTAGGAGEASFALVVAEGRESAAAAALAAVQECLAARGGGRGRLFQGRAASLDQRQRAVDAVAEALGE